MVPKVAILSLLFSILFQQYAKAPTQYQHCDYAYDGIDLKTKKYRRELAVAPFFVYTPPEVKNELKQNNLLETSAQLLRLEERNFLNLNIKINSVIAPDKYGFIDRGNLLSIKLIDGKEINLSCNAKTEGILNAKRDAYVYAPAFEIPQNQNKKLLKTEIDKIGIQWSSGYEEYTIYELDLIINQLGCLLKEK